MGERRTKEKIEVGIIVAWRFVTLRSDDVNAHLLFYSLVLNSMQMLVQINAIILPESFHRSDAERTKPASFENCLQSSSLCSSLSLAFALYMTLQENKWS